MEVSHQVSHCVLRALTIDFNKEYIILVVNFFYLNFNCICVNVCFHCVILIASPHVLDKVISKQVNTESVEYS
jgi:hypothetical protein